MVEHNKFKVAADHSTYGFISCYINIFTVVCCCCVGVSVAVCLSVSMSVSDCLITFDSLNVKTSFSVCVYLRGYGSTSYVKVMGLRSRSQK